MCCCFPWQWVVVVMSVATTEAIAVLISMVALINDTGVAVVG